MTSSAGAREEKESPSIIFNANAKSIQNSLLPRSGTHWLIRESSLKNKLVAAIVRPSQGTKEELICLKKQEDETYKFALDPSIKIETDSTKKKQDLPGKIVEGAEFEEAIKKPAVMTALFDFIQMGHPGRPEEPGYIALTKDCLITPADTKAASNRYNGYTATALSNYMPFTSQSSPLRQNAIWEQSKAPGSEQPAPTSSHTNSMKKT